MNCRELNGAELVRRWRALVNGNVSMVRDASIFKRALLTMNSVQILLGMYQFENSRTISIPQFMRQQDAWLELDEAWADVRLAILLSHKTPSDYFLYMDCRDEETTQAYQQAIKARESLQAWADRIIS